MVSYSEFPTNHEVVDVNAENAEDLNFEEKRYIAELAEGVSREDFARDFFDPGAMIEINSDGDEKQFFELLNDISKNYEY
jgi:hypothetical protein